MTDHHLARIRREQSGRANWVRTNISLDDVEPNGRRRVINPGELSSYNPGNDSGFVRMKQRTPSSARWQPVRLKDEVMHDD